MAQYRTVEGDISTTVDTLTNLTTFAAETAVGPVKVPASSSRLVEIWVAIGMNLDTAADANNIVLRLSGKGMKDGDQDFVVGGQGGGVTSTGSVAMTATVYKTELSVTANETINVAAAYTGDTTLAIAIGITLVFQ